MPQDPLKITVVGAGAVGAVYAYYAARGGAKVSFFVKEKHRENLKNGIVLYSHNKKSDRYRHFSDYGIISTVVDASFRQSDVVILSMSSTALRSALSIEILQSLSEHVTVVLLQVGIDDLQFVRLYFKGTKIITGLIAMLSYQAPLPGENLDKCIAFWFPPFAGNDFTGKKEYCQPLIQLFKKASFPTGYANDLECMTNYITAYFMPFLAVLENHDWSFFHLKEGKALALVDAAAREAEKAIALATGKSKPIFLNILGMWQVKMALSMSKSIVPFDLEVYFQYHFTKVKDQTARYLDNFIKLAAGQGLENHSLKQVRAYIRFA